jgi:4-hydroxyphenylacetate 3-monooxygenase
LPDGNHPAGRGLGRRCDRAPRHAADVEEYAGWYDRHLDPALQEVLLAPSEVDGERVPWAYTAPRGVADLIGMGRSFAKTIFLSAGNITHTPAYGNLIALGVLTRCSPATPRDSRSPRLWPTAS